MGGGRELLSLVRDEGNGEVCVGCGGWMDREGGGFGLLWLGGGAKRGRWSKRSGWVDGDSEVGGGWIGRDPEEGGGGVR